MRTKTPAEQQIFNDASRVTSLMAEVNNRLQELGDFCKSSKAESMWLLVDWNLANLCEQLNFEYDPEN